MLKRTPSYIKSISKVKNDSTNTSPFRDNKNTKNSDLILSKVIPEKKLIKNSKKPSTDLKSSNTSIFTNNESSSFLFTENSHVSKMNKDPKNIKDSNSNKERLKSKSPNRIATSSNGTKFIKHTKNQSNPSLGTKPPINVTNYGNFPNKFQNKKEQSDQLYHNNNNISTYSNTTLKTELFNINKKAPVIIENIDKLTHSHPNNLFKRNKSNNKLTSDDSEISSQFNLTNQTNQGYHPIIKSPPNLIIDKDKSPNSSIFSKSKKSIGQHSNIQLLDEDTLDNKDDNHHESELNLTFTSQEIINKQSMKIFNILKKNPIIKGKVIHSIDNDGGEKGRDANNSKISEVQVPRVIAKTIKKYSYYLEQHQQNETNLEENYNDIDSNKEVELIIESSSQSNRSNYFTLSKDICSNDNSYYNNLLTNSVKKSKNSESKGCIFDELSNHTFDCSEESLKNGKTTKEDSSKHSGSSQKKKLECLEEAHFAFVSFIQQSKRLTRAEEIVFNYGMYNTVTHIEEVDL